MMILSGERGGKKKQDIKSSTCVSEANLHTAPLPRIMPRGKEVDHATQAAAYCIPYKFGLVKEKKCPLSFCKPRK